MRKAWRKVLAEGTKGVDMFCKWFFKKIDGNQGLTVWKREGRGNKPGVGCGASLDRFDIRQYNLKHTIGMGRR